MLVSFSSNRYYRETASSTVATAISIGTPLIGDERLLIAYDYLPRGCMFVKRRDETDAAAMKRYLKISTYEERDRINRILLLRELHFNRNDMLFTTMAAKAS